jgi:hypothetical protein
MGTMEEKKEMSELESALVELKDILEDAQEFSLIFNKKIDLLSTRDENVLEGKPGELLNNWGYIPRLYILIEGLREVNKKNTESMNDLNKLI